MIDSELAGTMARASRFRNLLVHQYGTIDDSSVVSFLAQLDELESFVQRVLAWIEGE